jgi:hypothetical protein
MGGETAGIVYVDISPCLVVIDVVRRVLSQIKYYRIRSNYASRILLTSYGGLRTELLRNMNLGAEAAFISWHPRA